MAAHQPPPCKGKLGCGECSACARLRPPTVEQIDSASWAPQHPGSNRYLKRKRARAMRRGGVLAKGYKGYQS